MMAVRTSHTCRPVYIRGHIMPLHTIGPLNVLTLNQGYTVIIFIVHLESSVVVPTNEIPIVAGKAPNIRDFPAESVIPRPFGLDTQMTCGTAGPASSANVIVAMVINVASKAPPPEHIRNKSFFCTGRLFYGQFQQSRHLLTREKTRPNRPYHT